MNLTKMFETQRVLDERIEKEHPTEPGESRFNKKILSLLVELGECANEQRSWKFWSKDQEPRTNQKIECFPCQGTGDENYEFVQEAAEGNGGHEYIQCESCGGSGYDGCKNPLLEEYVDCLHFVLGIGNDKGWEVDSVNIQYRNDETIETQFNEAFFEVAQLYVLRLQYSYNKLLEIFFTLGHKLGFTPSEIESAYYAKNKINHERQENGY